MSIVEHQPCLAWHLLDGLLNTSDGHCVIQAWTVQRLNTSSMITLFTRKPSELSFPDAWRHRIFQDGPETHDAKQVAPHFVQQNHVTASAFKCVYRNPTRPQLNTV